MEMRGREQSSKTQTQPLIGKENMMGDDLNRREVMVGVLAMSAAVLAPAMGAIEPGPEFIAKREALNELMHQFRVAITARLAARERIGADMRRSEQPFHTFCRAPEIRACTILRNKARAAVEDMYFSLASNSAEVALQEEARALFYAELGGDERVPSRSLTRKAGG
jgi:hypothetical protein